MPTLAEVSSEDWRRLAGRTLLFAHQSVGGNLLDGVATLLKERPEIGLRVAELTDAPLVPVPALYHKRVGQNGKPSTKLAEFSELAMRLFDASATGIALMKFCYADVKAHTDPVALFEEYQRSVGALRAERPGLTIVHVTMPLWKDTGFIDHWGTIALGKATPIRVLNAARHRFNERMRAAFRDREPLFDLAALEAVRPDGSVASVRHDGARVPSLALEWTYDGGHLNEQARRRIAGHFLATLAKLPMTASPAVTQPSPS